MAFKFNPFTGTLDIVGSGGGGNAFTIIQPDSGTAPTAGSATDTLTLTSADIDISGSSSTNTITFTNKAATSFTLADNQFAPATIESFVAATYSSLVIQYSIKRNSVPENGILFIITDGTNTNIGQQISSTGSTGVTFSATISGSNLLLQYISTNTGFTGAMKYYVKKWLA